MTHFFYSSLIFLAAFIDSIVGGGGLITVPVITLIVGPGVSAIATNKILGLTAACTALLIYARKGHLQVKGSGWFLGALACGTYLGTRVAFYLSESLFKWILLIVCPVILYITLKRDSFILKENELQVVNKNKLLFLGFICGIYDGAFGPGGGTFMFLSLAIWGDYPVLAAIATAKLANTISAGVSLASYARAGAVIWQVGLPFMVFSLAGALIGAHYASRQAKKIVRPLLVAVVILLLIRLLWL